MTYPGKKAITLLKRITKKTLCTSAKILLDKLKTVDEEYFEQPKVLGDVVDNVARSYDATEGIDALFLVVFALIVLAILVASFY